MRNSFWVCVFSLALFAPSALLAQEAATTNRPAVPAAPKADLDQAPAASADRSVIPAEEPAPKVERKVIQDWKPVKAGGDGGFHLGLGLVLDTEYHDMMKRTYYDYDMSGGYGWLDLHFGYDFPLSIDFFSGDVFVSPTLALWVNYGTVDGDGSFFNTIILPGVQASYRFARAPSFSISAELNYNVPDSSADRVSFDDGGLGWGLFAGYETRNSLRFELGYSQVSTTVTLSDENGEFEHDLGEEDIALGGFLMRATRRF